MKDPQLTFPALDADAKDRALHSINSATHNLSARLRAAMAPRQWDDTERSFQDLLATSLLDGSLTRAYGWSRVYKVEREFPIHRAICDVVAFHADGSVTVFELKRAGLPLRDTLTGIGQLMHAGAQFELALSTLYGEPTRPRLALAIPSGTDADVGFACLQAGVEYVPFGSIEEHNRAEAGHGS